MGPFEILFLILLTQVAFALAMAVPMAGGKLLVGRDDIQCGDGERAVRMSLPAWPALRSFY